MRKLAFFLLVFWLALAGCAVRNLPDFAWCYRLDLKASSYGFDLELGYYYAGYGFGTDDEGRLNIEYTHGAPVAPNAVIFHMVRAPGSAGEIAAAAKALAFGIQTTFVSTIVPGNINELDVVLQPQNGGSVEGTKLAIRADTSLQVLLEYIDVRGLGANPFPADNCTDYPDSTPTPEPLINFPFADFMNGLADADEMLADADVPLSAPNGAPILPNETGGIVWSYAKWITSPNAAQKLMGPFAPIYYHVGYLVAAQVALGGFYLIIYGLAFIARILVWLWNMFIQILQVLGALLGQLAGAIGGVIGFIGRLLG